MSSQRSSLKAKKNADRRTRKGIARARRKLPSAATRFEMDIRANVDLNVTTRLLWFLIAMSHDGYTFITQAAMAEQLGTSVRQVQISLRVIIAAGYFRQVRQKGIHRALQYHRVYLEGESLPGIREAEFVRRIQADDRFDICVLLHWIACDATAASGKAQFPTPSEWDVSVRALTLARRKMERLGHFAVSSTPLRGAPAIYRRRMIAVVVDKAGADRAVDRTVIVKTPKEPALSEKARRAREEAEFEFGLVGPCRPLRRPAKKRVISFGEEEE